MINILICEDCKDIQRKIISVLSCFLEKYPDEIKTYYAINTEEAERIIRSKNLDIIFLELEFEEKKILNWQN